MVWQTGLIRSACFLSKWTHDRCVASHMFSSMHLAVTLHLLGLTYKGTYDMCIQRCWCNLQSVQHLQEDMPKYFKCYGNRRYWIVYFLWAEVGADCTGPKVQLGKRSPVANRNVGVASWLRYGGSKWFTARWVPVSRIAVEQPQGASGRCRGAGSCIMDELQRFPGTPVWNWKVELRH